MPTPEKRRIPLKVAIHVLALSTLIAVFATYLRPDFLVSMADQLWSCF
jgi:hypothetical protein